MRFRHNEPACTRALEVPRLDFLRPKPDLNPRARERSADFEQSMRELAMTVASARQSNRAKSKFLRDVSHELRVPLSAILGFGELLAMDDPEDLPPERRRTFAAQIVKAAEHMLALVDGILDLEQIDAGGTPLSIEPLAPSDLLDDCRAMIEPCAAQRGIRLRFGPVTPRPIQADRTRLRQVLLNLLSNAVKYNREGGSVVVDCTPRSDAWVRIEVRDTGFGLTPEQLQSLFQPYNRLGQETGSQRGTGIGLVVTKRLVELMGGKIGVDSEPGLGTRFWIEFQASVLPAREAVGHQAT